MSGRTDRNERLFGADGQAAIAAQRVTIVGLGGLGSHVAQQVAYLGVLEYRLVDEDIVTESSLNRLIGAWPDDPAAGRTKVEVAERTVLAVQPSAKIRLYPYRLEDERSTPAFDDATVVIGCLDDEPSRLRLTEITMREGIPYLDLASDIDPEIPSYGGRVFFSIPGVRCMSCVGVLDQNELRRAAMTIEQRAADDRLYGVRRSALDEAGPAVVSINGTVASLAVTEFMVWATGLRDVFGHLVYLGHEGVVRRNIDPAAASCFYCRPT